MNEKNDTKISFKIITLGDYYVGKTSIIKRFVSNIFDEKIRSTVGMDFSSYDLTLKNNKSITLTFVDTSGTEKFKSLTKGYFKNADGILFVFDVSNKDTFDNIDSWMTLSKESNSSYLNLPKVLVGNKNDLDSEVEEKDIQKFLKNNPGFMYKSTSAKKSEDNNIKEMFQELGEILYENYKKTENIKVTNIKLRDGNQKSKKCCNLSKLVV